MGSQVTAYLQKIMEQEVQNNKPFTKNILHFGGGGNTTENQILASYLSNYESIVEDTIYGANVTTFLKDNNLPFQTSMADSIRASINRGVALMTFFRSCIRNRF